MPVVSRTISGVLKDANGSLLTNTRIELIPVSPFGAGGILVAPISEVVITDGGAAYSVDLLTTDEVDSFVRYQATIGNASFTFDLVSGAPTSLDELYNIGVIAGSTDEATLAALLAGKANDNAVVHLTGNENVAGVKTFSSSPLVPAPTTDLQAATKKYVDDNAGGSGIPAASGFANVDAIIAHFSTSDFPVVMDVDVPWSSGAKVMPDNALFIHGGGKFILTSTASLEFQGPGLVDAESQNAIFSAGVGKVTFTGTNTPKRLSTSLWDTGNNHILDKIKLADAAVAGKVCTLLLYDGLITGGASASDSAEVASYHHILNMGELTNTWDATLTAAIPFLLNDHTSFRSSPGARINESSVVHAYNMAIIAAKMMTVAGSAGTCTDIFVEDNYFVGNESQVGSGGPSTVHLGNVITGGINRNTFDRTHGYNCFGGYGTSGNCANGVTFYDNKFIGVGNQVCAIINAKNFHIARNIFDQRDSNAQTSYTPLDVEPNTDDDVVENGLIENNFFDCRDYNVATTVSNAIQVLGNGNGSGKNITVRHNTIFSTDIITTETTQPLIIPIAISSVEECYIYGNTIRGASQATIYATNCRHAHIHDNEAITQFSDNTTPRDIRIHGCADSQVYNNHLRAAIGWTVSGSQDTGIYEHELFVPIAASGSNLTFVGGFWAAYFRDFWKGLKATINNIDYTFGTYTSSTSIATTASVGTVATKTIVPADINTGTNVINKTAHGFVTGSYVMLTTTGTLPAPMPATHTFYGQVFVYIIRIDNDNFKLANTLAEALATTAIDLTNAGTGTHTLTNIMVTKFSSNKYSNNEAAMGIRLEPTGASEILSTLEDHLITPATDANYTATTATGTIVFPALTAPRTVNLPDATVCKGKEIWVKDGGGTGATYNITWDGNGSQTIDGAVTLVGVNANWGFSGVKSNGVGWITITNAGSGGVPVDANGRATVSATGSFPVMLTLKDDGTAEFSVQSLEHGAQLISNGPLWLNDGVYAWAKYNITTRTLALKGDETVASAAALVPKGNIFHVSGTTNITSINTTGMDAGTEFTMIFDGILTVTDGNNLKLAGNFVTAAGSTMKLAFDGTNCYELSRSTN